MNARTKRILLYHIYNFTFMREKEKQTFKALPKSATKREKKKHEDFCYQYAGAAWGMFHIIGDIHEDAPDERKHLVRFPPNMQSKAVKDAKVMNNPLPFLDVMMYLESLALYVAADDV